MKQLSIALLVMIVSLVLTAGSVLAATTWQETQPAGNMARQWNILATSTDGQTVIAGVFDGRLYLSTDAGARWTETQPAGNTDGSWQALAMSSDGQQIVVGNYSGRLYVSNNRGSSWNEIQPVGNASETWITAGISDDGQTIMVAAFEGRAYLSTDGGENWIEVQPGGNADLNWYTLAISGDGQTLYASVNTGRIYRSVNQGADWSETQPAGNSNQPWRSIDINYDGQIAVAAVDSGSNLYRTTNQGSDWSVLQPAGAANPYLTTVSMSADSQTIFATGANGKMYLSSDGGDTWSIDAFQSSVEFGWNTGIMSQNATHFYVGEWIGRLYHGEVQTVAQTSSSASTSAPVTAPGCNEVAPVGQADLFQINRSPGQSQLFFSPVSGATKYHVVYGFQVGDERFGALSQPTNNDTGVQTVTINGLDSQTTYWFKVIPVRGCAPGNWSNWLKAGPTQTSTSFFRY